jgi:hypothetical protein
MSSDIGDIGQGTSGEIASLNAPDLGRNSMRSMWVFADIVTHSAISNTTAPLLRFMPVDATSHQISYETFGALMFKPISKTYIRDIRIWFSESYTGEPLILSADSVVRLQFDRINAE